jgi:hypothetical protein
MNRVVEIGVAAAAALIAAPCAGSAASVIEGSAWTGRSADNLVPVKLQCDFKNGRVVCGDKKNGKKNSHNDDGEHHKKKDKNGQSETTQSGNSNSQGSEGKATTPDSVNSQSTTTPPSSTGTTACDNVLFLDYCNTSGKPASP